MTDQQGSLGDLRRGEAVRRGSDRGFGLVFAVAFAVVGSLPLLRDEPTVRFWALAAAGAFLIVAAAAPKVLAPLNRLWFKFGLVLHRVVNPVVLGLMFFVVITPAGLIMKMFGLDPLKRRMEPGAETYWIERDPPGPDPESLRNQF